MTANSEQMTHAERVLWLAEREEDCLVYHSTNIEPGCTHTSLHCSICICHGTGKVPRYPMLRQECLACRGAGIEALWIDVYDAQGRRTTQPKDCICSRCVAEVDRRKGCGWVPDMSLEALVEAAPNGILRHCSTGAGNPLHLPCPDYAKVNSRGGYDWYEANVPCLDSGHVLALYDESRGGYLCNLAKAKTPNGALSLALMQTDMARETAHPGR